MFNGVYKGSKILSSVLVHPLRVAMSEPTASDKHGAAMKPDELSEARLTVKESRGGPSYGTTGFGGANSATE